MGGGGTKNRIIDGCYGLSDFLKACQKMFYNWSLQIRLIPMYVGSHSSSSVTKTNVSGGEELFVLTKIRFGSIP